MATNVDILFQMVGWAIFAIMLILGLYATSAKSRSGLSPVLLLISAALWAACLWIFAPLGALVAIGIAIVFVAIYLSLHGYMFQPQ